MDPEPRVLVNLALILVFLYGAMFTLILVHHLLAPTLTERNTMHRIVFALQEWAVVFADTIREQAAWLRAKLIRAVRPLRAAILRRQARIATAKRAEHGDPGVDALNVEAALASINLDEVAKNPGQPVRDWNATP